jgi:hypothetical protein
MGMSEEVSQGVNACFISTSLEFKPNPIQKKKKNYYKTRIWKRKKNWVLQELY